MLYRKKDDGSVLYAKGRVLRSGDYVGPEMAALFPSAFRLEDEPFVPPPPDPELSLPVTAEEDDEEFWLLYDEMRAWDVIERVKNGEFSTRLRAVLEYEREHKARKTVLAAIDEAQESR